MQIVSETQKAELESGGAEIGLSTLKQCSVYLTYFNQTRASKTHIEAFYWSLNEVRSYTANP